MSFKAEQHRQWEAAMQHCRDAGRERDMLWREREIAHTAYLLADRERIVLGFFVESDDDALRCELAASAVNRAAVAFSLADTAWREALTRAINDV